MKTQEKTVAQEKIAVQERVLVTGASSRLGQLVLEELLKAGHRDLIAMPRSWKNVSLFSPRGVDLRSPDCNDQAGLVQEFRGVTRVLLISTLSFEGSRREHRSVIESATKAGVRHIVYASCAKAGSFASPSIVEHRETETLIKASGLKYTFLRNCLFAENLQFTLPLALETGKLYGCAGDGRVAYLTRRDCAAAIAGALLHADRVENAVFDLTGPHSYSHRELADLVSELTGKKVSYEDVTSDQFKASLVSSGFPEMFAPTFVDFDVAIRRGVLGKVTDSVRKLTGKPAEDIREVLKGCLH